MKHLLIILLLLPITASAYPTPADMYVNIRKKYEECVFPSKREVYQQTYKNNAGAAFLLLLHEKDHTSFLQGSPILNQEETILLECVQLYYEAKRHLRDTKYGEARQALDLCQERLISLQLAMEDIYGTPFTRFKENVLWLLDVAKSHDCEASHQNKCPYIILKKHPLFHIYREMYPSAIIHESWRQLIELHAHSNSLEEVENKIATIDERYRPLVHLTFRTIYSTGPVMDVNDVWEYAKGMNDGLVCIYLADLVKDSDYSLFDIDAKLVIMMLYERAKILGVHLAKERQELELYYASPKERISLMKLIEKYVKMCEQRI